MANWKTFATHHAHAASAMKAKDHAKASHHVGHLLAALRAPDSQAEVVETPQPDAPVPPSLRSRLAQFRSSL